MPNELNALFNIMLELKKHKQTDEFLNIVDKYGYSSKAKMMIALKGLDDAALSAKQIKSIKAWDGLVVSYTEHNLLFGLCILMRKLNNAILNENWVMGSVYANDVKNWLYILDDKEYDFDTSMSSKRIIKYYNNIAIKYKIDL